ncbi:MAG: metal-sensitive transcriptional regulator [Candidatus Delongbacteria bacterium]|nr:metal-sensitive transcriptional regulator [Candidatus Delongbacteria bacterium]
MLNAKQSEENINRLNKIEGQVRGIKKMIEDHRYCIDILTQTKAIRSAIVKVEEKILENHLNTCVRSSFKSNNERDIEDKIGEIIKIISNYMK